MTLKCCFPARNQSLGFGLFGCLTLAACSLIPNVSSLNNKQAPQVPIQLAGGVSAVNSSVNTDFHVKNSTPQILTFSPLAPFSPLTAVTDLPKGKVFDLNLVTDQGRLGNSDILVSPQGLFRILFQVGRGGGVKVLDNNTTDDGQAIVQVPEGIYDGFVGADTRNGGKLAVEDSLYYLRQEIAPGSSSTITTNGSKVPMNFFQIGTRQLPVSSNWSSSDGQSYVLSFNNQGVNQATIRWNPSSNTVPLPPGIKEIGPLGGFVELPNVGRLDIPPNALTQSTLIKFSQEFSAPEVMGFSPYSQNFFKVSDYISPVVKLSPLGLVLNQPATLHLTTNVARLGNNHPRLIDWLGSLDKSKWEPLGFKNPSLSLDQWSPDEPALIDKLQYVSKQISASIMPDDNLHVMDSVLPESDSFRTQALSSVDYGSFRLYWNPIDTKNPKEIINAAQLAYQYYASVTKGIHLPPMAPFQEGHIPIVINKNDPQLIHDKIAGGTYPDSFQGRAIVRSIKMGRTPEGLAGGGIAHEMWHVFQYAGLQNGNILFTPSDGKQKWYDESTAGHMAGRVAKIYSAEPVFNVDRNGYQDSLKEGLENSTLTINFNPNEYDSPGFFTYLAHQDTGLKGDSVIAQINTKVINNSEQFGPVDRALPLGLSHYFNLYATESYIYDRFNIYNPASGPLSQKQNVNRNHNINNPLHIPLTLKPLSAAYYSINTVDPYIIDAAIAGKAVTLKVKAKSPSSSCPNGFKDLQLVSIKYPDPQSDHDKYDRSGTYKQAIPMDGNWQTISGKFLLDYDHIVLAASNGQWKDGTLPPACSVDLDVAVTIPQYLPIPVGCGYPCYQDLVHDASANFSWPSDPYPSFPGQKSSASVSLGLDLPDGRGYNYAINSFTYGFDADGKQIVTNLVVTADIAGGSSSGDTAYDVNMHASVNMSSQDGKNFTVQSSQNSNMTYGYSYNSNTILDFYKPSGCNPSVSGFSTSTLRATSGKLTMYPPVSGSGTGTATFNLDLSGPVQVNTNSTYWCSAALAIYDPLGNIIGSTPYGHKNTVYGTGEASVSMNVLIGFQEITY